MLLIEFGIVSKLSFLVFEKRVNPRLKASSCLFTLKVKLEVEEPTHKVKVPDHHPFREESCPGNTCAQDSGGK